MSGLIQKFNFPILITDNERETVIRKKLIQIKLYYRGTNMNGVFLSPSTSYRLSSNTCSDRISIGNAATCGATCDTVAGSSLYTWTGARWLCINSTIHKSCVSIIITAPKLQIEMYFHLSKYSMNYKIKLCRIQFAMNQMLVIFKLQINFNK